MTSKPQHPQVCVSPHETRSFSNGARLPFRKRFHVMFLFLATAFAAITLLYYSHRRLGENYPHPLSRPQACQSLDPHITCVPEVRVNSPSLTVVVEPSVQSVIFSLVMFSEQSAKEGVVLLKVHHLAFYFNIVASRNRASFQSAIMYTSWPLHFHIICDEAAQTFLETGFLLLTHPLHSISVRFYRLSSQSMSDRISREGSIRTGHSAGNRKPPFGCFSTEHAANKLIDLAGLMKLFMHELLPDDVDKAIYVDTDAFFLTDPALLWEEFSHWNSEVSISMPYHPNMNSPETLAWHNATRICSCIMLLRFDMFRAQRLMDSSVYRADHSGLFPPALSPPTFEALFGPPGPDGHYIHVTLGDQTYWWAIVSNRMDLFRPLSYDWGVTNCMPLDMFMTGLGHDDISEEEESRAMVQLWGTPYEGQVVIPKILHLCAIFSVRAHLSYIDVFSTAIAWMISSTFGTAGLTPKTALRNAGRPPSTTTSVSSGSG